MTYGENKKLFLSLVDELAPGIEKLTEDEDIINKLPFLYSIAYQELADKYTKPKIKEIEIIGQTDNVGYQKEKLPKCKQVKSIKAFDSNYNQIHADYKFLGENVLISNKIDAIYAIEYVPFIQLITESTVDSFELELDQDLQTILPVKVASDLFKTDPGENYRAFEQEFQRRLNEVLVARKGIMLKVTGGEI